MSDAINVANASLAFSPSNCVPQSNPAIFWDVCLFFAANILAHAATIHPRTGATKWNSFRRMMLMIVAPVTAGTVATYAIVSFILGIKQGGLKWAMFLDSKESLQDAVAAGAVGILVPRDYAPVLGGRWKLVGDERHSLMLNHQRAHPHRVSREPHVPSPDAKLEFILPPQSRLPGYADHKFYPSSSSASELIAIIQLTYGVYQLVTQYGSEINLMGLSSPYTFVIPYLFMSAVNLIANIVMPSYSHVVILPPERSLSRESSTNTLTSTRKTDAEDMERGEDTGTVRFQAKSSQFRVGRRAWRHVTREIEVDKHYMSITGILARGKKPQADEYSAKDREKFLREKHPHLSFITWSVRWSWFPAFGNRSIYRSSSWSRECPVDPELERKLQDWLARHYPGVETDINARPLRIYQKSRYISVITTLAMTTLIIGVITRFQFMVAYYTGKFLSLIYVPPTILLIPFILLGRGGSSVRFWHSVETFSNLVNNLMISAYVGAGVALIQALCDIGNCTIWSQADNQTWLQSR